MFIFDKGRTFLLLWDMALELGSFSKAILLNFTSFASPRELLSFWFFEKELSLSDLICS